VARFYVGGSGFPGAMDGVSARLLIGVLWMAGWLNERTLAVDLERWMAWVPMGIPDDPPCGGKRVLKEAILGIQSEDKEVLAIDSGSRDRTQEILCCYPVCFSPQNE